MVRDIATGGDDVQLFPEEWRDDLDRKLANGIATPCPHCSGNTHVAGESSSSPDEPITFVLDEPSDADKRKKVVDSLLMSGTYVTMLLDEECAVVEKRNEPFFAVLSLGDDGEIHVETLNRKGMAELHVSSARVAAIAERSATRISETAADVRAVLRHVLTANFGVPKEGLDGVPDVELVGILDRLHELDWDDAKDAFAERMVERLDEGVRVKLKLIALLGDKATEDDKDPDKTSMETLLEKVEVMHIELVEKIAAAVDVDLTLDMAADIEAILERLRDLTLNDPDTIIKIGVALGMDEGDMRQKLLTTPGDEKAARAELAKSVTDTAKVMLARFKYACEAAGLDRQTRDGDPGTAMQALSAKIKENRLIAEEVRKWRL